MLCYNQSATSSRIRGIFVPVIAGHSARPIIRIQQGTTPRWLGVATKDGRSGVVHLGDNMDAHGNETLRDKYPIECQVCHNLIASAIYDGDGALERQSEAGKVVGLVIGADGIPLNLYAHWGCLRLEPTERHVFSMPPIIEDDHGSCLYCGVRSHDRFCSDRCAKMHARDKADAINEPHNQAVMALIENLRKIREESKASEKQRAQAEQTSLSSGSEPSIGKPKRIMVDGVPVSRNERQVKLDTLGTDDTGVFVPQNEMGVVFLLGGVIDRIGYRMAYIDGRYPDAVLVDPEKRKIKTELEFNASSFIAHGHDPDLCDLVICWNDDAKLTIPTIALSYYYDLKTGSWDFSDIR